MIGFDHDPNIQSFILSTILLASTAIFGLTAWGFTRRTAIDLFYFASEDRADTVDKNVDNTQIGYKDNLSRLVKRSVSSLYGPEAGFRGVWWLPGGHAQTAYNSFGNFTKVYPIVYERKYIQLVDGGLIALDVTPPFSTLPVQENERVLVVSHGLTGGSHEAYVRAALAELTLPTTAGGLGFRAVVVNSRGCSGAPVITPRLYNAGSSDDLRPAILWVCHTFPKSTLFGIGFSLGANILTKHIAEESESCPLSGAVALANVWDFVTGSIHIESGTFLNRHLYRNVLGGAMKALLHRHQHIFHSPPPNSKSPFPKEVMDKVFNRKRISLKEYDDLIQAPMFGFRDAMDYYDHVSSAKLVERIRVPLLGINSWNDPVISSECLPIEKIRHNPWVVLAVTHGGGHLGWFEQDDRGNLSRWYVKPVKEYFIALLESNLEPRPKPEMLTGEDGFTRLKDRPDVGFRERQLDKLDIVTSGAGVSKLTTGW